LSLKGLAEENSWVFYALGAGGVGGHAGGGVHRHYSGIGAAGRRKPCFYVLIGYFIVIFRAHRRRRTFFILEKKKRRLRRWASSMRGRRCYLGLTISHFFSTGLCCCGVPRVFCIHVVGGSDFVGRVLHRCRKGFHGSVGWCGGGKGKAHNAILAARPGIRSGDDVGR